MSDFTQGVAGGLRRMNIQPDAFLFCEDDGVTFDEAEILGIPVFHSALIINTYTDLNIPFIPIWKAESDYIIQRGLFNDGYEQNCNAT